MIKTKLIMFTIYNNYINNTIIVNFFKQNVKNYKIRTEQSY